MITTTIDDLLKRLDNWKNNPTTTPPGYEYVFWDTDAKEAVILIKDLLSELDSLKEQLNLKYVEGVRDAAKICYDFADEKWKEVKTNKYWSYEASAADACGYTIRNKLIKYRD